MADGPLWSWAWTDVDEPRLVVLAAASAVVDLLLHGPHERVRACPGRDCGWLFLDASGRRRWCRMAVCGNRAKQAAHAARNA